MLHKEINFKCYFILKPLVLSELKIINIVIDNQQFRAGFWSKGPPQIVTVTEILTPFLPKRKSHYLGTWSTSEKIHWFENIGPQWIHFFTIFEKYSRNPNSDNHPNSDTNSNSDNHTNSDTYPYSGTFFASRKCHYNEWGQYCSVYTLDAKFSWVLK